MPGELLGGSKGPSKRIGAGKGILMAYSSPAASFFGFLSGLGTGEAATWFAGRLGASERGKRVAGKVGHFVGHSAAGWVINAVTADVIGAGVTTGTAAAGAAYHSDFVGWLDNVQSTRAARYGTA